MSEINKLREENKKLLEIIKKLEKEIQDSAYYKEGSYAIEAVERGQIIEKQEKEIQDLKNEIQKLKCENRNVTTHNERGAGRKSRFSEQEKEMMKMYRIQGKTIKEIAEMYSCSVGLIHKIIN
ncbi:hypothetical protein ACQPVP_03425 [Clostridium nigeriense]|uniref:hypothetical protein n=1 Tax=Clostridium nigeriense TaxID=1805470 RepID=UPI003D3364FD